MFTDCPHTDAPIIVKTIVSNGHTHIRKKCPACGRLYGNPLSKKLYDLNNLPFHEIESTGHRCVVQGCEETNVEWHHFFPVSLAQKIDIDPNDWPAAYLCEHHHILWHAIVTPGLDWRSAKLEKMLKKKQP